MEVQKLKGHVAMLAANTMWGLMAPAVKYVIAGGVISSLVMTDLRIIGAAILFWITSLFLPSEKVPLKDKALMAGAGMLGILFNQGCYVFGVGLTSPGDASSITTTMPMWVMILAWLLLGEPITMKKAGGIALGACGALILVLSATQNKATGDNPVAGDILVLCAQISYALYLTFYRNFIKKYSLVTLMKWMFTSAAIVIIPFSINQLIHTQWSVLSGTETACVCFVVFFSTYIAYICIMTGQKQLRPTLVGMYNYFQPIVATGVAFYLGLETFTVWKALAVALIFTGVYLVAISKAKSASKAN